MTQMAEPASGSPGHARHPRDPLAGKNGKRIPVLKSMRRRFFSPLPAGRAALVALAMLLGGCANTATVGSTSPDPWEPFNRVVYGFNDTVDRAALRPVASGYRKILPLAARRTVGNFFNNLRLPTTIINDLLQGKSDQARRDFERLVINTTLGLLGGFDVAASLGWPLHKEDYGQTLAVWGVPSGPYLVLPFLGPSTARDALGELPGAYYTDPLTSLENPTATFLRYSLRAIDARANLLDLDPILQQQLDPYLFIREAYLQKRWAEILESGAPLVDSVIDIEKELFND